MASYQVKEPTVPIGAPVARSVYESRNFEKLLFYTVKSRKKKNPRVNFNSEEP